MVGLSCWMNDSKVEAPIRSPAAANTVFGYCARSWSTAPPSTAAPASMPLAPMRPWKSLMPSTWMVLVVAAPTSVDDDPMGPIAVNPSAAAVNSTAADRLRPLLPGWVPGIRLIALLQSCSRRLLAGA